MPRNAGFIKTYGRHKFRTVRTAPWVSPDDVFRSPVSKKEKSFETPTTIRKSALTSCTNLPKPQWNIPKHKTPYDGKENFPITDDQHKEWKTNLKGTSTTSSSSTPTTEQENCSKEFSTSALSISSPELSVHGQHRKPPVIPETPEWAVGLQKTNSHKVSTKDSYQKLYSSIDISPNSIMSSHRSNVSKNESSSSFYQFSNSDTSIELPLRASKEIRDRVTNEFSCSTSTPLIRANSRNSQLVTLRCRKKGCLKSQNLSVSDCQVFVEPIKLTPEQYQAARLSISDINNSLKSSSLTVYSGRESSDSGLPQKTRNSLNGSNYSIENPNLRGSRTSLTSRGSTDGIIRECVVSLEKLRLSPLVGQEVRKRSSFQSISGSSSSTSISSDNIMSMHLSPRKQASQMLFMEALTPLKVNPAVNKLTAYQKLLLECEQEAAMSFHKYLNQSSLKKCVKVGEGVYGEVFKTVNNYKQDVALKIIPINGDFEVNGEPQKSSEEILPEIIISKELSALKCSEETNENSTPNFIDVNRVSLVQDKYPAHLIKEWIKWDKNNQSENDNPDIFPLDQLFLIFEFANGGQDLEHFEFNSYSEAFSVLQQITLSLAIAESRLEFEHRDLHWGNVLIIRNDKQEIDYCLNGQTIKLDSHGVHVSIIDFTLSRLRKDGITVFCNLSEDESLFTGKGDYQFEIYRQMRKINEDNWEKFSPATNVQWLHYLADKIIRNKKYPSRDRKTQANLRRFFSQVQDCHSAQEVVYTSDFLLEL